MLEDWANLCRWGPDQTIAMKFGWNKFNLLDMEKKALLHPQHLTLDEICNASSVVISFVKIII